MLEENVLNVLSSIYYEMKTDGNMQSLIPIQVNGGQHSCVLSVCLRNHNVLSIRQSDNSWIPRNEFDSICKILEEFNKEIFRGEKEEGTIVDIICQAVEAIQSQAFKIESEVIQDQETTAKTASSMVRMWLKLVSLSTKSKRKDLVEWGRDAGLTGFVMAGKPGLLCFEADEESDIDSFMARIKTQSWSDIPAVQKKITVVLIETIQERVFQGLEDITSLFKMGGFLESKPDMGQVRQYLFRNNVGHVFEKVFL